MEWLLWVALVWTFVVLTWGLGQVARQRDEWERKYRQELAEHTVSLQSVTYLVSEEDQQVFDYCKRRLEDRE